MTFQTSTVTVSLCYFIYLHELNLKLRLLHLLCSNITVNMTKVKIKIFQGSTVTETAQGKFVVRLLVANPLQYIMSSLPKTMKIGRQTSKLQTKTKWTLFIETPCRNFIADRMSCRFWSRHLSVPDVGQKYDMTSDCSRSCDNGKLRVSTDLDYCVLFTVYVTIASDRYTR